MRESDLDIADGVKDVVIRALELDLTRDQLPDQTPLYSSLVRLDSLTLLQLIVALEQELGIEIDDEDVMNADLRDIGSLVGMVVDAAERRRAGIGPTGKPDTGV